MVGQAHGWMKQLADSVSFKTYASIDDFKAKTEEQGTIASAFAASEAAEKGGTEEIDNSKGIRLLIVDVDMVPNRPLQTIAELKKYITERNIDAPGAPLKVLVMAYEAGIHKPEALMHEVVDDLILKPVDKSLFQQKIEILTADTPNVSPTFLFSQKTNHTVEVGKEIVIDEISEFAVAVRNPGPLNDGVFAIIHCDVFGARSEGRLIGRAYESVRHPVREGEYLVKFSFFGISVNQLANVRKYLRQNQMQVRTRAPAGAKAGKPAPMPILRRIAVIDMNPAILTEVKDAIESTLHAVEVRPFPSYTRLFADIQKLIAPNLNVVHAETGEEAAATAPAFPGGESLDALVRGGIHELVRFEPMPKKGEAVLGRPVEDWMDRPDDFIGAIEKEDREAFEELMACAESGTKGQAALRMRDANKQTVYLEVKASPDRSSTEGSLILRLELRQITADQYLEILTPQNAKDPSEFKFDAIILDAAFLRPTPERWYEAYVELLRSARVLGPYDDPPKILVLSDPKAWFKPEDFRAKGVTDFQYKPIDRVLLARKVQAFMPDLPFSRPQELPPFMPCELQAKLGKEVQMSELSEFGLTILQKTPFRQKIMMRFFSKLWGEDGAWVAGRCLACEQEKDGIYRCRFMFFGPADDLLQRIRRFIREDYVAKKEGKKGA